MFINDNKLDGSAPQAPEEKNSQPDRQPFFRAFLDNKYAIYISAVLIIIAVLAAIIFLSLHKPAEKTDEVKRPEENGEHLPEGSAGGENRLPGSESRNALIGTSTDFIQAEYLTFGNFYRKDDINFETNISKFNLPVKTKTDVANYHYINRKINLDNYLDSLDENGFVIIGNPYKKSINDFYGMYSYLEENGMPVLITDDFTVYFFQNFIKQIYKDIEKDFFYDSFFNANNQLFNAANERYRERLKNLGVVNDSVLEGERLEAVFLAVALELLKPAANQVSITQDPSKFSGAEAEEYNFFLPEYLSDQVEKEISLIKEASQEVKSPSTFNLTDYREFKVPDEYKSSAKLNNFYLALKWMNSVFPLYSKGEDCPDCFIDEEDWVINFIAGSLLAKDFSGSQEIKNNWAKIYKIISYFSGLRSDLTYLYYNNAYTNIFGENYDIGKIFSSDNPDREENIRKIKEEILKYNFFDIEGGYDRNSEYAKPILGLRILTEPYWPSDYIFSQLVAPFVGAYNGGQTSDLNRTYCRQKGEAAYRCKGFGMDIVSLIYPVQNKNDFYLENINYSGYGSQSKKLTEKLDNFNTNSWYNNNFWSTLRTLKFMLNSELDKPSFAQSGEWEEKEINTALGAWVNFQLPPDTFSLKPQKNITGFEAGSECNKYNYVEPNLELIKELQANSRMLYDMLDALGIAREVASVKYKFDNINLYLSEVENIVTKELQDNLPDEDDCLAISNIINQFVVKDSGKNNIKIQFKSTGQEAVESVDGVKLMIVINKYGDEKNLIFAPIFNYINKTQN